MEHLRSPASVAAVLDGGLNGDRRRISSVRSILLNCRRSPHVRGKPRTPRRGARNPYKPQNKQTPDTPPFDNSGVCSCGMYFLPHMVSPAHTACTILCNAVRRADNSRMPKAQRRHAVHKTGAHAVLFRFSGTLFLRVSRLKCMSCVLGHTENGFTVDLQCCRTVEFHCDIASGMYLHHFGVLNMLALKNGRKHHQRL